MKKLMFVAAAAAAGLCWGDVTSANIVGYAGSNLLENGSKAVGVNFIGINGTPGSTTLTSLKVAGYTLAEEDGAAFEGLISAMKLDGNGKTVFDPESGLDIIWQWGDWYEVDENDETKLVRRIGWMNDNGDFIGKENGEGVMVPDIPLAMGEAVWVQSDSTTWQIQCAGEVYNATVPIELLENGSKFCANACPANIGLSKTFIGNYTLPEEDGAAFEGLISAMKLDGNGKTVADPESGMDIIWQWGDWYEVDENDETKLVRKTGWMNDAGDFLGKKNGEGVMVPDVPLAIGEGVWVQSDSTTWQFVFPNVFEL
jgi:hypothetical protein